MRLKDRAAIITGAASGIGQATAHLFAAEGARVLAVDRPETGLAQAHENKPGIVTLEQDVTAPEAATNLVEMAVSRFGGLDIVMNNAGVGGNVRIEEMTDAVWARTMDVNLNAPYAICKAAVPHLKKSSYGRIINVASVMAKHTDYGLVAYCASKSGITGMTRNLALELGKYGITANCILPGAIHTGMTAASFANEDIADIWARKSPLRRLGQPVDIARGALFLASDDGGFVTGHDLNVDGGMLLRS